MDKSNAKVLPTSDVLQLIKKTEETTFKTDYNYEDLAVNLLVDVNEKITPPEVAIYVNQIPVFNLGDFSLIIGKAKSRKSFFISSLIASCLTENTILENINGSLPIGKKKVIYFDTEMARYDVQKSTTRILAQSDNKDNLKVFCLRKLTPAERLQFVEETIQREHNDTGLVVIDGIKDLITSINDEEQANIVASKLLKWTETYNIHITTVLHQNKGKEDRNARGHLGTELTNKAQSVLEVSKSDADEKISVVIPLLTRGIEPPVIAFEINEQGIPVIAENFELRTETKKNKFDVGNIVFNDRLDLLEYAFKKSDNLSYKELQTQLKLGSKNVLGRALGDNQLVELITLLKNNDFIQQEKPKAPYYRYKHLYKD
jgi:hypothetical protein